MTFHGTFQRRRYRKKRYVLAAILILATIAWGFGLVVFVHVVSTLPRPARSETQAIVVLTGGSLRLETGLTLLRAGWGEKLFVSGVHRGVDVAELLRVSRQSPEELECCIVLGYTAEHTLGNARETAHWMKREGFTSMRLVTANYHMPRSLLEFRAAMPYAAIVPHPVFPSNVRLDSWWVRPGTAALLAGEYTKYLLAWVHTTWQSLRNAVTPVVT